MPSAADGDDLHTRARFAPGGSLADETPTDLGTLAEAFRLFAQMAEHHPPAAESAPQSREAPGAARRYSDAA